MRHNGESTNRLRNVDLNLLKVFNAVLSQRNISQAAAMLCVSQPAVSNALRRLRDLYDDPLFVRTSAGMVPTPKARELSAPIAEALAKIDETMTVGEEFRPATSQRVFTVSLTDYGEFFFLPKIIQRLVEEAPGVEVICVPSPGASLGMEMKSGSVDLTWDWIPVSDADFSVECIFEDLGCCLARKDHPVIKGKLSVEAFLEAEHITLRPTRHRNPRVERALEKQGLQRKVVAEVSHLLVMPKIVAKTDLIATMPERLARLYAKEFDLQIIPNPIYQDTVSVYQIWHRNFVDDEGHRWFRELMKSVVLDA